MKIAFRVDASLNIGSGHVMRCLALANELRRMGHLCWFICRDHSGHLGDLIEDEGHFLSLLPTPKISSVQQNLLAPDDYEFWLGLPWQEDSRQTLDVITRINPEWLIVDHYALDAKWESVLASAVTNIMVIDDLADRAHVCRVLLDQNLGRITSDYDGLLPNNCQRIIGPRYALLRPEFAELRKQSLKRRRNAKLKRILISFGGGESANVTGQALKALITSSLPSDVELDIVMGSATPYTSDIHQQAALLPFRTSVSVNVKDMATRMCLADVSLGAVGGTSWERACLGLPALIIVLAKNQIFGAEALEMAGAAINIGNSKSVRTKSLPILLGQLNSSLLNQMSKAAANITDGLGASRVAHTLCFAGG